MRGMKLLSFFCFVVLAFVVSFSVQALSQTTAPATPALETATAALAQQLSTVVNAESNKVWSGELKYSGSFTKGAETVHRFTSPSVTVTLSKPFTGTVGEKYTVSGTVSTCTISIISSASQTHYQIALTLK